MINYFYLLGTLLFTLYGQLIIKARADVHKIDQQSGFLAYLFSMLTDIGVLSGLMAAFFAAICWLLALRNFEISYAYPFMALSFVLVPVLGWSLFGENLSWQQFFGSVLIVTGVTLHALSRG